MDSSGEATTETVQQTLDGALALLDNGQRWTQGGLRVPSPGGLRWCVVGALEAAAPNYASYEAAVERLKLDPLVGNHVDRWNNRATWPEVAAALGRAAT